MPLFSEQHVQPVTVLVVLWGITYLSAAFLEGQSCPSVKTSGVTCEEGGILGFFPVVHFLVGIF